MADAEDEPWNLPYNLDEDQLEERKLWDSSKCATLVFISAQPDMFRPWEDSDVSGFKAALECCEALWRSKVISSPKDKVALVYLGTEETKEAAEFEHMYTQQPFSEVTAGMIKELRKMIASDTLDNFEGKVGMTAGTGSEVDLKKAFWLAKIMFEQSGLKSYDKKIMFFTCDDNPHKDNQDKAQEILQKFEDLGNVDFSLVAFNPQFDESKIYSQMVRDPSNIFRPDDLNKLKKIVRIKQRAKRPIVRSTVEIAHGVKFGVGLYSCIREAKKPQQVKIKVDDENEVAPGQLQMEVAEKQTTTFNASTGLPVLRSDIVKSTTVAGKVIDILPEDLSKLRYAYETGIRVLGFLDSDKFNHTVWHRKNPYFLYPDEGTIIGSTALFTSLLRRCAALKKIILVRFVLTRGRNPQLGCMIPSLGKNELTSGLAFPQGFHLTSLPFANEIRIHEVGEVTTPPEKVAEVMKSVVKKLTKKDFKPTDVQNPTLYSLWRHIESYALEIPVDEQEEFVDFMEPDVDLMKERLGSLPTELDLAMSVSGISKHSPSKEAKTVVAPTFSEAENAYKRDKLNTFTVDKMKAFCAEHNIRYGPKKGFPRKADLVEAIKTFFEKRGDGAPGSD